MYCTKCGTEIKPNAKFCTKCGKPVDYSASKSEPAKKIEKVVNEPVDSEFVTAKPIVVEHIENEPVVNTIADDDDFEEYHIVPERSSERKVERRPERRPEREVERKPERKPEKTRKVKPAKKVKTRDNSKEPKEKTPANALLIGIIVLLTIILIAAVVVLFVLSNSDSTGGIFGNGGSTQIEDETDSIDDEEGDDEGEDGDLVEDGGEDGDGAIVIEDEPGTPAVEEVVEEPVEEAKVFPEWNLDIAGEIRMIDDTCNGYKKNVSHYKHYSSSAADYYSVDGSAGNTVIVDIFAGHGIGELRDTNSARKYYGADIFYVEETEANGTFNQYYFSGGRLFACNYRGQWYYYGGDNWERYDDIAELLIKERREAVEHFPN